MNTKSLVRSKVEAMRVPREDVLKVHKNRFVLTETQCCLFISPISGCIILERGGGTLYY